MWKAALLLLTEIFPILVKIWESFHTPLAEASKKVREVQADQAKRIRLSMEGKEDELSRMDYYRNLLLLELLRERGVRPPEPSQGVPSDPPHSS